MKLLVAGARLNGSWSIRGQQLGTAIGAKVEILPKSADGFDAVIVIKRSPDYLLRVIPSKKFKVWDVVDAWPQPIGNSWTRDEAMRWLRSEVARIKPNAIVAATQKMAEDCEEFKVPVICIPHHARPDQEVNPIRPTIERVGYEGSEQHLGSWDRILEKHCQSRGWEFVMKPRALADLDIVVGLRDATGYPAANWKSNVKLANAQATGTPCILSFERGYIETQSGAECWAENEQGLNASLERLRDQKVRAETSRVLKAATPYLNVIAQQYLAWLQQLKF